MRASPPTNLPAAAPPRPDADAAVDPRLRRATREFESIFLSHLLKTMHTSGGLFEEPSEEGGGDLLREMTTEQLGRALAQGEGIGLARMLEMQLRQRIEAARPGAATPAGTSQVPPTPVAARPAPNGKETP